MSLIKALAVLACFLFVSFPLQADEYNPSFLERNTGAIADIASTYNFVKKGWPEKNDLYNKACKYRSTFQGLNVKTREYDKAAKKFTLCAGFLRLALGEGVRYATLSSFTGTEKQKVARQFDIGANAIGIGTSCRNLALTRSMEKRSGVSGPGKANRAALACAGLYLLFSNERVKRRLGVQTGSKQLPRKYTTSIYFDF